MAEAHAAVAFTFTVSSEGLSVDINRQALAAVFKSGSRAWKKRVARFKNSIYNQVYPFHPSSWFYVVFGVFAATYLGYDNTRLPIPYVEEVFKKYLCFVSYFYHVPACLLFSLVLWFCGSLLNQLILRSLLSYTGWMYVPRGKKSYIVGIWMALVKLAKSRHPRLYGYQYSLPSLPLPRLQDTIDRCLLSLRHLHQPEEYDDLVREAKLFLNGPGPKLQFFLWLKTWITSNYVTDWWEDYVYLANRDPLISNTNFYGLEWRLTRDIQPTQAARAAMVTYLLLQVRRQLIREQIAPIFVNGLIPLCSWQYERTFNTTRIACLNKDKVLHWSDSTHIVAYHRGRYYRCPVVLHGRNLTAAELEYMFNYILHSDTSTPCPGEEKLAAFTAGPRDPWAVARSTYFSSGVNRTSLDCIEKAAFFIALDEDSLEADFESSAYLSYLGKACLNGNCCNRWFDKSFSLVVQSDGACGFNAEHSWGDAPILAHAVELVTVAEYRGIEHRSPGLHYMNDGSCDGQVELKVVPHRLAWDMPQSCIDVLESSFAVARGLADSTDLVVTRFREYGRGFMKRAGYSPDAYIQIVLQVAYYLDQGKFSLVYESSMTRLFREGRTETVRSCTAESTRFVRALLDEQTTTEERLSLFRMATDRHQRLIRDAISGKGVDRHLFALYIVSKFLHIDNPFLKKILSQPWCLSTSQTPTNQTSLMELPSDHPDSHRITGGGFGPVDKDGYGVSYIFSGDNAMCFHVSSRHTCPGTSSERFTTNLIHALGLLRNMLEFPKTSKAPQTATEPLPQSTKPC